MTNSEMSLAYTLFCIKYDGWNVRDIPNIKHASPIEKIEFDYIFMDGTRFGFNTTKNLVLGGNTLFYRLGDTLRLNRSGIENLVNPNLNSYSSLESFLKDFEISLEDIV